MKPTDISAPDYFHKVVDCQWACPAHTPVPEYIRLIAEGRYSDAYMINWKSNVFPGILGRTCDRPCEPACRRGRVEETPVAICRLKRVAADFKDDVKHRMPRPSAKNGKRIAIVGGGPASLTVARDLAPLGYHCIVFDTDPKAGGMMRSQIPKFRLPDSVIDEETDYILGLGIEFKGGQRIESMKKLLAENYDAIFVGSGAPRGRELDIPGRKEAAKHIHIGIDWLSSVSFGHTDKIGRRVIVLGGGNTAMDCCRTARRLGGEDVKVIVRSGFEEMKASPWEKEDALHEDIPILNFMVPVAFTHDDGKLTGVTFQKVKAEYDAKGRRNLVPSGEPDQTIACDDVLVAVGQENAFPWIERDCGIEFDKWNMPQVDAKTFVSTNPKVFFGGDAAFGPKNIIWAVAHGHDAALSIHRMISGEDINERPLPEVHVSSQKMGIHEWSYDNDISGDKRYKVPHRDKVIALKDIRTEVELGYDVKLALGEAQRCLNCDVQTVFSAPACIECDACVDICPMDCITFTENGEEADLRQRLKAPSPHHDQALYVAEGLKTGRVMVKDKDVASIEPGGYLFYDSTKPMPTSKFRADINVIGVPLTAITNSTYTDPRQRQLFKNIIYLGALCALLDLDPKLVEQLIGEQYKGKEKLLSSNVHALHLGRDWALQNLKCPIGLRVKKADKGGERIFIEGNSAAALGAAYGGATVCAWYPITPSSSLADAFASHCKKLRHDPETGKAKYAIVQGEDELASIGIVIGASWNGARAFTATSGPGISLMTEFIGLSYFAEIPAVIMNIQRAGPSTGMPTRTQQCDIIACAYASHGDTKHVLLFPEDPAEAFEFAAQSFDLADRLQTMIFLMLDLDIGMNHRLCRPLKWDDARQYDRGKVMTAEMLDEPGRDFGRYLDVDGDGIPYRTYPGTHPTKGSFFTRATSRDRYARYSEEGAVYAYNMQRLVRKFETAKDMVS